ncbi:YmaF family protein [Candidatus Darwinibacter acetoxidans]|jgi:hypothetical protein|nr:YmaF family protein [Bacillota bacterium]
MVFTEIPHNHRFAGMTGQVIPIGNNDHIHAASGISTLNRGHVHDFVFATLIDDPLRE